MSDNDVSAFRIMAPTGPLGPGFGSGTAWTGPASFSGPGGESGVGGIMMPTGATGPFTPFEMPTPSTSPAASCCPPAKAAVVAKALSSQVTDAVTQESVHALGMGPAMAAVNAYLGQAQAQSLLYANMVNQQAQQTSLSVAQLARDLSQMISQGESD